MTKFKDKTPQEIEQIYDMVSDEIDKCLKIIQEKTKYYCTGQFLLFAEEPKKCMDIDFRIALLETPHGVNIDKVEYYTKVNPDNVLEKPIIAYKHNSWYMIYDGVHRTTANTKLGKATVRANIIIPNPKDIK